MLVKKKAYYDPLGADPTDTRITHVVITTGPRDYKFVSATIYIKRPMELALDPEQRVLSIHEARETHTFERINPPETDFAIASLEREVEKTEIKPLENKGKRVAAA